MTAFQFTNFQPCDYQYQVCSDLCQRNFSCNDKMLLYLIFMVKANAWR